MARVMKFQGSMTKNIDKNIIIFVIFVTFVTNIEISTFLW